MCVERTEDAAEAAADSAWRAGAAVHPVGSVYATNAANAVRVTIAGEEDEADWAMIAIASIKKAEGE